MENENSYASPRYNEPPVTAEKGEVVLEAIDESSSWPWRWRDFLILPNTAALPPRCVQCGAPSDRPVRPQKVKWFSPWLIAFAPLSIPVMLVGQKKGVLFYTLCDEHDRRQKRLNYITWGLVAAGLGQFVLAGFLIAYFEIGWPVFLMLAAILPLIGGALIGSIGSSVLHVERIDQHVIWLKHLPHVFIADLPQLRSANGREPIIPGVN